MSRRGKNLQNQGRPGFSPRQRRDLIVCGCVALVICVAVFALKPGAPSLHPGTEPAPGDLSVASSSASSVSSEVQFENKLNAAHQEGRRKEGGLPLSPIEQAAGLQKREANVDGERTLLNIALVPERRCMFGDLDLILKDMKHASNSMLLLTVEPLTPASAAPLDPLQIQRLTAEQASNGANVRLELPASKEVQHLGLFVCLDVSNAGKCAGKPPMVFSEQLEKYSKLDKEGSIQSGMKPGSELDPKLKEQYAALAADKIYYFSYIGVSADALAALPPQANPQDKAPLAQYLTTSNPDAAAPQLAEVIARYNNALNSVPLDISSEQLQLSLPLLDLTKCQ